MAISHTIEVLINRPVTEIFNALSSQARIDNMRLDSSSPEHLILNLSTPNTKFKWGQSILIAIFDKGIDGTLVRVLSRNRAAGQIVDGGKNEQNCINIISFLEAALASQQFQNSQNYFSGQPLSITQVETIEKNKGCLKTILVAIAIFIVIVIIRVIMVEMGLN